MFQGINSLDGCKLECEKNQTCLAIDFNTEVNECFLHFNGDYVQTLGNADTVNQYRVASRCITGTTLLVPTTPR